MKKTLLNLGWLSGKNFFTLAALALVGLASSALAVPIPVNNHSFEDADLTSGANNSWSSNIDVPGDGVGDPNYWVDTPLNNGNSFAEFISGFASEGANHLGVAQDNGGPNSVTQTLTGVSLLPNMLYTLTVGIGNRPNFTAATNASSFGLNAGATQLGRTVFNASVLPDSTFADQTFLYFSGDSPPTGELQIVLTNAGPNRSHFDNIRLDVSDANIVPFRVSVNRETGEILLANDSGVTVDFAGISLTSVSGTLRPGNWTSITGNYDATGNGGDQSISSDDWLLFSSEATDLSEGTLGVGTMANGESKSLGNTWARFYDEDVAFQYLDANSGQTITGFVEFVGNGGEAFEQGDINFDGFINASDWPTVRDNFNTDLSEMTAVEAYGLGDINGDLLVDATDAFEFKTLFEAANPGIAFSSIVPEPTSAALMFLASATLYSSSRRSARITTLLLLVAVLGSTSTVKAVQVPITNHSFEDATLMGASATWSNLIDVGPDDPGPDPDIWVDAPTLNSGEAFAEYIANFSSEGLNHMAIDATGTTVTQTLTGITLQPNSLYTMTVGIGNRGGFTDPGNMSTFSLLAGGTSVGSTTVDATAITAGTFRDSTMFIITGSTTPSGNLAIELRKDSDDRAHFDNIRLDRTAINQANILTLDLRGSSAILANNSVEGAQHDIDYYEIASPTGLLQLGNWTSLQDHDFEGNGAPGNGNGWEEFGNLDGTILSEFYLQGSSVLNGGQSVDLGDIYGGGRDITLNYRTTDGVIRQGLVLLPPLTPPDYNSDGKINGADFLDIQRQGLAGSAYALWESQYGSAAGLTAAVAVPEPSSVLLAGFACVCLVATRYFRWQKLQEVPVRVVCQLILVCGVFLLLTSTTFASKTPDRIYTFGDDPDEDASPNTVIGSGIDNVGPGFTLDSSGPSGAFIDLNLNGVGETFGDGDPMYVTVGGDRPGAGAGELGAAFDGDDFLSGPRLGLPDTSISDITQDGPLDYTNVRSRGYQLWVKPQNNTTLQSVVLDSDQFGVQITANGNWSMRFAGDDTESDIPINVGVWTHVMVVSPTADGSLLYIDGIAAAADGGGFTSDDLPLVVGGEPGAGGSGVANGFIGTLDNLEMFVMGNPPITNQSYGIFNLATDNDYIASLGLTPGDISGDHVTDNVDVGIFVENWRAQNIVNGRRVGDLNSLAMGDLNFDGIVNFSDWFILRANHPDGPGLNLAAFLNVPEPASAILLLAGSSAAFLMRRR